MTSQGSTATSTATLCNGLMGLFQPQFPLTEQRRRRPWHKSTGAPSRIRLPTQRSSNPVRHVRLAARRRAYRLHRLARLEPKGARQEEESPPCEYVPLLASVSMRARLTGSLQIPPSGSSVSRHGSASLPSPRPGSRRHGITDPLHRPILTPKTVLPLFFTIGIIFAPIGGLLLYASAQVCLGPSDPRVHAVDQIGPPLGARNLARLHKVQDRGP